MIVFLALTGTASALEHTPGLRYRYAWIPSGILDIWYFDSDDEGAQPLDRPKVRADIFGLEYTLSLDEAGGPGFLFYAERMPFRIDAGYWDDKESPADHIDGDWLQPNNLGTWNLGANFIHEIPFTATSAPVWASFVMGGGLGLAVRTGDITLWHNGLHPETVDPDCGPAALASERWVACEPDGELAIPGAVPILDVFVGTKLHVTEYAAIRFDLGLHNLLYFGFSGGGSF